MWKEKDERLIKHINTVIDSEIATSFYDDSTTTTSDQAVSNFRLFGIIIGIFDIVVGGLGNFFTILAFTRWESGE